MKLNSTKTKIIVFNFTINKQAVPLVIPIEEDPIMVVDKLRLLGLLWDQDLSWWPLVEDIKGRVRAKLWLLYKFREAGANTEQLLTVYTTRIRPVIEYAAQVYGCLLNGLQARELELLQSHAVMIVLGSKAESYAKNLITLGLRSLGERRETTVYCSE